MTGNIFDIQLASTVDGPGFRTTVFFKGCNMRCAWCHNPESQASCTQLLVYEDRCINCGACLNACPYSMKECTLCGICTQICLQEARSICGKEYSRAEVMDIILRDKSFYTASGGGATFSGGECMLQEDFLADILSSCKENGIHTAVDTAGNVPYSAYERIFPYTDMFLYDVKIMDTKIHKKYTGVNNFLILDNLAKILSLGIRTWIRVPIIPGVNDTVEEMRSIRVFLLKHGYPEKVELLPYHRMGENKYTALKQKFTAFDIPNEKHIKALQMAIAM